MTTRNYNTTLQTPYVRVKQLVIKYGTSDEERVRLSIVEGEAIVDADGNINSIAGITNSIDQVISLSDIASGSFSLINPDTGEELPQTMAVQDLYVAMVSYIRKIQKEAYPG